MVIPTEEGRLKEARYIEDNIIISYSTLRNMLPPQLKKMAARYKVMYGCECYVYVKIMHYFLLTWRACHLKHLKDRIHNAKNISAG